MDYDYTKEVDAQGNSIPNPNYESKSFWKWQWDSLKISKFLINKTL